ncbi:class II fructose-bisphosphate aldolase [Streptomyces radicis]|uniref:Class II fructose-bisphosphate aldolase n=1 Tax=Streptomyces radicis TaxID=1750517 RepID=A0A3A9WJS5_9ACTN|nr:class II fructose-bisphosphate aldolase [Streptomyces radicis]RKN09704.1 class II fructose-bisphosphate aldolase [Streptomyces radicis]RKN23342.1 class II fructose-bisphosphate aldolase [Streptomyces radicis]
MTLVPCAGLLDEARAERRALVAFNVITLEHAQAVAAGAGTVGAPAVLAVSQNAVAHHGGRLAPLAAALVALARDAPVPLALHLDHVTDEALLRQAPAAGFGSVMFDGSRLPYGENVAATVRAARFGRANGLLVEAELGRIGGKPGDAHLPGVRTDPDEAVGFVTATGVDALAVAVGSSHAMTARTAALDHALIRRLRTAVTVPLVLHGSSGVPDGELRRGVAAGLTKVNVGTALNAALTDAVREGLAADPSGVDPRPWLAAGRAAMTTVVERFLRALCPPRGGVSPGAR